MRSFRKIVSNQSTSIVFKTEYTPLLEPIFIDQVIAYNVILKEAMSTLHENLTIKNDALISMHNGLKVHAAPKESAFHLRFRPKIYFDDACKNGHFIIKLTTIGTISSHSHGWLLMLVNEIDTMLELALKQRQLLS
jgi:hypothetical protein